MKKLYIIPAFLLLINLNSFGGCTDSDPTFIIKPASHPNACVAIELENIDPTGTHTWTFNPTAVDAVTSLPVSTMNVVSGNPAPIIYWTGVGDKQICYDGACEWFHSCNCNPLAADNFYDAPLICNTDLYCGTTSSAYGVDQSDDLECNSEPDHSGSLENNSWIKFIAASTSVTFNINVLNNCFIQFAVYEYDPVAPNPNDVFTLITDYNWTDIGTGFTGNQTIVANPTVPGVTYYLHFDGHGGAECDYEIGFVSGAQLLDVTASAATVCLGAPVTLTAAPHDPAAVYTWWDNQGGGPYPNNYQIANNPSDTIVYYVQMTSCQNKTDSVVVNVVDCGPLGVDISDLSAECDGSNYELRWTALREEDIDYYTLMVSEDGENFSAVKNIEAVGNGQEKTHYSYTYRNSGNEELYFKLNYRDNMNNNRELSKTIATNCLNNAVNIYSDMKTGIIYVSASGLKSVSIYNAIGKLVHLEETSESVYRYDGSALSSGIYLVSAQYNNDQIKTERVSVR